MAQGELFEAEHTYGVGELAARVTRAVASAFPTEVWLRGEVDGLRPPNASGHVYFSLCEKNSRRGPTSTMAVSLFRQDRLRVDRELREWPDFRLADGLEIRIRGRVQYTYGRLQFVMSAVDPLHTLGRLAADRDRVLRALAADGLIGANRRRPLATVPLTVAIVTSAGSAAAEDVLHELTASGFGFRVLVADARVQGGGAENSVLRALRAAERAAPDVVLLVRGGGARTDLATFDSERVARAVANLAVPVFTGIGLEIDTSVADEVAHTAYKTPTACAGGVVELVRLALERAEGAWAAIARHGRSGPVAAAARLDARASRLAAAATGALDRVTHRIDLASQTLDPGRLDLRLRHLEADLATAGRRLGRAAAVRLDTAGGLLDLAAARTAAADPARVLARGFSLTRTARGRLVRRAAELAVGDTLVTTFGDGSATAAVTGVEVPT